MKLKILNNCESFENIRIGMTRKQVLDLVGKPEKRIYFSLYFKGRCWYYYCNNIQYKITFFGNRLKRIYKTLLKHRGYFQPGIKKSFKELTRSPLSNAFENLKIGMTNQEVIELIGKPNKELIDEYGRWVFKFDHITYYLDFDEDILAIITIFEIFFEEKSELAKYRKPIKISKKITL